MKTRQLHAPRSQQSGVVLMIGMVILLMLTLVSVGVVRLSTRHTQVVNNEQVRGEATAAANYALDMVLNEPASGWTDLAGTAGRVELVNLGLEKTADSAAVSVSVTVRNLTCKRARIIKNAELMKTTGSFNYFDSADVSCQNSPNSNGLTIVDPSAAGSTNDNSNCGNVLYDMEAEAADAKLLNATAKVVQGVEVRTDISTLNSSCG